MTSREDRLKEIDHWESDALKAIEFHARISNKRLNFDTPHNRIIYLITELRQAWERENLMRKSMAIYSSDNLKKAFSATICKLPDNQIGWLMSGTLIKDFDQFYEQLEQFMEDAKVSEMEEGEK